MKSYFSTNRVVGAAVAGVALAALFSVFGCKKDITTDTAGSNDKENHSLTVAAHEGMVAYVMDDLFHASAGICVSEGVAAEQARTGVETETEPCRPFTKLLQPDWNTWPKTITVDYPANGCADEAGRVTKGKMSLKLTQPLYRSGATLTIAIDSIVLDGILIKGENQISKINYSITNGFQYTSTVNAKIFIGDSIIIQYTATRNIKQTAGAGTSAKSDDVFSIEGNATMAYLKGGPLGEGGMSSITTITPLQRSLNCRWINAGQTQVRISDVTAVIDYGKGICDGIVTIKVNDKVKEVTLPR